MVLEKYIKLTWLFVLVALLMVSCKNEIEPILDSEVPEYEEAELVYEANPRAFALKFTDYIGDAEENIKRLDKDTIQIAINEGLLEYLQISELQVGDVLNIWENIGLPPYIRIVDAVEKRSANYIVTTHSGNMTDLFVKLEGGLSTELFSDISDRPHRLVSRTGNPEDDHQYVDGEEDFKQFVDDSGMIHPFIIYQPKTENSDEFTYDLAETEYDEIIDSFVDSKAASRSVVFSIINYKKEHINIHPKKNKDGFPIGIFVSEGSLEAKLNIELYFKYNLFKSNCFWAKTRGSLNLDIPLHVSIAGMQLKEEKDIPLFELMPIFTGFAIGPFVVPIVIRRGIVFKYSGEINGNISFMAPIYCNSNFAIGPMYDNYHWSSFKEFNWHAGIYTNKLTATPSASLSMKGKVGVYIHAGAYFGSAIGPFFEVGPQAVVEGNAGLAGKEVYFNTKGTISIGGSVGAEIKLWKFNLGKAALPFSIKSLDLWNESLKFNAENLLKVGSTDYSTDF